MRRAITQLVSFAWASRIARSITPEASKVERSADLYLPGIVLRAADLSESI